MHIKVVSFIAKNSTTYNSILEQSFFEKIEYIATQNNLFLTSKFRQKTKFFDTKIQYFSPKNNNQKIDTIYTNFNKQISLISQNSHIDTIPLPPNFQEKTPKLVVLDVDSTLIENEMIDLLAKETGKEKEISTITKATMEGKIEFSKSLIERVKTLQGTPYKKLEKIYSQIQLTPGASELITYGKKLNWEFALISGGFIETVAPLAKSLGIKYFSANKLEIKSNQITGKIVGKIVDENYKAQKLLEYAQITNFSIKDTIAIGDGANDISMLKTAGIGIAFNAKLILKQQYNNINFRRIDTILSLSNTKDTYYGK